MQSLHIFKKADKITNLVYVIVLDVLSPAVIAKCGLPISW